MFLVNQNKTRKSWHIVDVRVLFWSTKNKIYCEKILLITPVDQKIALPFYVMLILHLVICNCDTVSCSISVFNVVGWSTAGYSQYYFGVGRQTRIEIVYQFYRFSICRKVFSIIETQIVKETTSKVTRPVKSSTWHPVPD